MDELIFFKNTLSKLLESRNNQTIFLNWLRTELAYTSNAIEGNTLTRKETERVIDNQITTSSKPFVYYQEAVNHAKAFNNVIKIVEQNLQLNEEEILNLHKIILSGIDDYNAGFYRDCRVRISGSSVVLPNPVKVPILMNNFCDWLSVEDISSPVTAMIAHLKFVSIHPFVDGNGRCARLLMNTLLLRAGFAPIIIRPRDRKRYLDAIGKAQLSQDSQGYIKFMTKALIRSLKTAIALLDITKEDTKKNELLTIAKFAKCVELPVSTIRVWTKTNKIKPHSYTDSGYMLFSKQQVNDVKKLKQKYKNIS